jgi:hypothetical protein
VKIHYITAIKENSQIIIIEGYTGYQGVLLVSQVNLPVFSNPGKLVIYPEAEAAVFALDMIFLANMRKVKITNIIMTIEADEEFAVSNRDISWHLCILLEE